MKKLLGPIYNFYDLFQFSTKIEAHNGPLKILRGPLIPILLAAALMIMTGIIVYRYLNLEIWRHDSFQFTPEYTWYDGNLKQEGRWINYFLFDVLKSIPGHVAALSNLFLLFIYGFFVSEGISKDFISRVIFGLVILTIPVFHAQNMWPNITFGAMIFLPLAYFLSKKLPPFAVFVVSAIYYFGTLSNFYFLVPLIYLGQLKKSLTGEVKSDLFYFSIKIVLPYVLCFIIGFLFANGIVMAKTGNAIAIGEWRKPSPANNFDQLLTNISGINNRILGFGTKLFSIVPKLVLFLLAPMLLLSLNRKSLWIVALLLMVFLSAFYTTVYHGITISERTLCVSVVPFVLFFCFVPALRFKSNILHLLLCVAFVYPSFIDSSNQLQLFAKITSYYRQHLELITETLAPPENYEMVIFAENSEVAKINKQIKDHYGLQFKWGEQLGAVNRTLITPLRSLGFYRIFHMTDKKLINDVKAQIQDETRKDPLVLISLNNRPNSMGVLINNTEVDSLILDQL